MQDTLPPNLPLITEGHWMLSSYLQTPRVQRVTSCPLSKTMKIKWIGRGCCAGLKSSAGKQSFKENEISLNQRNTGCLGKNLANMKLSICQIGVLVFSYHTHCVYVSVNICPPSDSHPGCSPHIMWFSPYKNLEGQPSSSLFYSWDLHRLKPYWRTP